VFYEFLFFSAKGKLFNRKEWISGLMFLYQNIKMGVRGFITAMATLPIQF
jgi:hypothetical protein